MKFFKYLNIVMMISFFPAVVQGNNINITKHQIQPDGKIVTATILTQIGHRIRVTRQYPDRRWDTEFGTNGAVETNLSLVPLEVLSVNIDHDNRIMVTLRCAHRTIAQIRYLQDGTLDQSFGADGIAIVQLVNNGIPG